MVLAIIAILAGLVAPYAKGSSAAMRLHDASLTLAAHVRYAEALAIDSGQATRLRIDVQRGGYCVEVLEDASRDVYVAAPGMDQELVLFPAGISVADLQGRAPMGEESLTFDPAGNWSSGRLRLTNGASTTTIAIGRSLGEVTLLPAASNGSRAKI